MERKNPDYTASAVNLRPNDLIDHPTNIEIMLYELDALNAHLIDVQAQINEHIPAALTVQENDLQKKIAIQTNLIKQSIDVDGSFQDLTRGWYAVKQRKVSVSYLPGPFKKSYPAFAPAVIVEAVNTKALEGLVKGGLISHDDLKANGVTEEKESFVYIVKVG